MELGWGGFGGMDASSIRWRWVLKTRRQAGKQAGSVLTDV